MRVPHASSYAARALGWAEPNPPAVLLPVLADGYIARLLCMWYKVAERSRRPMMLYSCTDNCCRSPSAIKQIRGSNKVVDQDPEGNYEALSL
jgi:hypothetical protein